MNTIFNCTKNNHTTAEERAGIYTVDTMFIGDEKENRKELLTFHWIPSQEEMEFRAHKLAQMARETGATKVLLNGEPFFMSTLERAMRSYGILPIYAFSDEEEEYVEVP